MIGRGVGCPKIATRIRACALFWWDFELKILRMRGFSSRFLDNQPENCCIYIVWTFFWNQSFISKNTHFEMSILTQIGFSSNLMASGTVQQLDKSSWPSQIPIVCRLGKGSPMPETHTAPNHTPTIADFVPKWLNTPTLD